MSYPAEMTRIVAFSDLHGNTPALQAFLAESEELRPDVVVNLGDIASGAVDPRGTLDVLATRRDIVTVRGNHERALLAHTEHAPGGVDDIAARVLTDADRRWFDSLPQRATPRPRVLAFHGTPTDDLTYLLETVDPAAPSGIREANDDEVIDRLGEAYGTADVFLCGHTHLQRVRELPDGSVVVNPGSLGWPAFAADAVTPHRVETGSPLARFAVLDSDPAAPSGWRVTPRAIDYPVGVAARLAEECGRTDIARALTTGLV